MQLTLRIAREVQQKLFPAAPPASPGFELAGRRTRPRLTGGDYYDYIPLPDGGFGVAVGDVCGHGVGPALLMAATRAYLRALALTNAGSATSCPRSTVSWPRTLTKAGSSLSFLARLEPDSRTLVYVSAGHPRGYVLRQDGLVGPSLGARAYPWACSTIPSSPRAPHSRSSLARLVLLLTDGVVEAYNSERAYSRV